jgi:hypothetical protein
MYASYESMARVGREVYNDFNFCGVIATATACNVSFGEAHKQYKKQGRVNGVGTNMDMYKAVFSTLGYTLRVEKGWQLKNTWAEMGTTRNVAKRYPKGTFLIRTRKHIYCLVNGYANDWNDAKKSGHGSKTRIYSIVEVTEKN